ncbi:DNA-binding transcriptional regulator, AcrR family [Thermomonospora echinospora]|uniref:DNA-binding transcriptional regulator, AcrR family n=1 Tax=Thermomonospora echinospora TaxID=1992 RepID=A0A1H6E8F3_9ACTN|nr:TetR/AcrR family transcriptional regulator [Thermomonospora echinospora]SEG94002.1 DNA-binding transcriptional regulator, AcrR family [Thermomonospora echinospora]
MSDETSSTRDRLLAAAERLLLSKDPDQVSVRAVNAEAGLNSGAVHYHFGSREGLIAALLERELVPVWADRLAPIIRRSEQPDEGEPFSVADLVAAIVQPFEELVRTEKGRMLCRLLARTTLPRWRIPASSPWFSSAPFEVMLGRAMPELSVREISERWRLAFTLLLEIYGQASDPSSARPQIQSETLIAFLSAGLTAPAR